MHDSFFFARFMPLVIFSIHTTHLKPKGVEPGVVEIAAERLGFDIEYSYVKTGRENKETGEWTGKVGEVIALLLCRISA